MTPKMSLMTTYPLQQTELLVANVHALNFQPVFTYMLSWQLERIREHVSAHDGPVIVCGENDLIPRLFQPETETTAAREQIDGPWLVRRQGPAPPALGARRVGVDREPKGRLALEFYGVVDR